MCLYVLAPEFAGLFVSLGAGAHHFSDLGAFPKVCECGRVHVTSAAFTSARDCPAGPRQSHDLPFQWPGGTAAGERCENRDPWVCRGTSDTLRRQLLVRMNEKWFKSDHRENGSSC